MCFFFQQQAVVPAWSCKLVYGRLFPDGGYPQHWEQPQFSPRCKETTIFDMPSQHSSSASVALPGARKLQRAVHRKLSRALDNLLPVCQAFREGAMQLILNKKASDLSTGAQHLALPDTRQQQEGKPILKSLIASDSFSMSFSVVSHLQRQSRQPISLRRKRTFTLPDACLVPIFPRGICSDYGGYWWSAILKALP